jgi:hypothetical protein
MQGFSANTGSHFRFFSVRHVRLGSGWRLLRHRSQSCAGKAEAALRRGLLEKQQYNGEKDRWNSHRHLGRSTQHHTDQAGIQNEE